ncbi:SDR family oxidoreductase [Paenibacillus sp.]|uniref:SDR family oxidoreductase n=1 Tax=Paenibacillus sp. TaxID=58172 RepID=UPI002D5B06A7|nr:SDR family oxidoreductase [Paenibacillus sp.]HZG86824.1 SDR family oxidoreductase [Paenibacillus sp.]
MSICEHRPVALVTGASAGFGLHCSIELAKRGFLVVAAMRDPAGRGAALTHMAAREGVGERIAAAKLDVTDAEQIEGVVRGVVERYGRIDVLLNNAGYAQGGFVEDVPLESFREQFETNVWGLIAMTKAVLPYMRERRSGTIINMSSVSGRLGLPGFAPYAASKFAVEGFSEALRLELRPFGVHVVLIEPGSYRTDIWAKGFARMAGDETSPYASMLERVKRAAERSARAGGDPRDVARLAARAASARRPKLRYALPASAALLPVAKALLPWSLIERAIGRALR